MKKIILLAFSILCCFTIYGQELSRKVIGSSGDYHKGTNVTLSWTIGETIVETFIGANSILTQGFQQSSYSVTGIKKLEDSGFQIKVFPNPASDFINISFITKEKTSVLIELIDLNGKILLNEKVESTHLIKQINFTHFTPGTYFLRIKETNGKLLETYQIQKIINL